MQVSQAFFCIRTLIAHDDDMRAFYRHGDRPGHPVPVGPVQSVIGQLLRIGAEHVTRRYPGLLREGRRARERMPVFAAQHVVGARFRTFLCVPPKSFKNRGSKTYFAGILRVRIRSLRPANPLLERLGGF